MNKEFRLPDVGEGLTEADIVSWHVKPGDTVTINQVIVEIETAKAVVELPSPYAGTVSALLVAEGQTVDVGIPIITIDVPVAGEAAAADAAPAEAEAKAEAEASRRPAAATPAPPARQPVLVGYGVKPGSTSRRRAEEPADPAGLLSRPRLRRREAAPPRTAAPVPVGRRPPGTAPRMTRAERSPSRRCDGSPGTSASTSPG